MTRSLPLLLTGLLILCFAYVADAQYDSVGGHAERGVWNDGESLSLFDETCTDSFDTPAPPSGARALPETYDTPTEVIDVIANIGSPQQLSGSADGWCDHAPWTLQGDMTLLSSPTRFYFGPMVFPGSGYMVNTYWPADQAGWRYELNTGNEWSETAWSKIVIGEDQFQNTAFYDTYGPGGDPTTPTVATHSDIGPIPAGEVYFVVYTSGGSTYRISFDVKKVGLR
ncbi:MAG: hypothetical protein V3S01_09320 [Dehalococcoidia bacterium]